MARRKTQTFGVRDASHRGGASRRAIRAHAAKYRYTRRCGDIGAHAATPYLCFRRAIKRMRGRVDLAFPVPGGRELGPLRQDAYPPAGRGLASFVSGPVCPPAPQAPHPVPLSRRLAKRPSADGVRQSLREVWRAGIRLRSQLPTSPRGEAGHREMRIRSRLRHSIEHYDSLTRYE